MKVFQISFDVTTDESKEVTREVMYFTGCWITICEWAIRHSEEYEKTLVSISDVLTVTQQLLADKYYYPDDDREAAE